MGLTLIFGHIIAVRSRKMY